VSTAEGFHSLAEARSWALHAEVAARLAESPELVLSAQERVAGWLTRREEHPYAAAWDDLLQQPLEALRQALTDKGEHMCTLRQASPFAGALDARTRWSILKRPELRPREAG
jgi:hypothetical protein